MDSKRQRRRQQPVTKSEIAGGHRTRPIDHLSRLRRRELRRRDLLLPAQLLGFPRLREAVGRAGGGGGGGGCAGAGAGAGEVEGDGEQRGGGGDRGARGGEGEQPPPQRCSPRRSARGPHLPAQRHLIRVGGEVNKKLPPLPTIDGTTVASRARAAANWTTARRCALGYSSSPSSGEGGLCRFVPSVRACVQSPQRRGKTDRGRRGGREEVYLTGSGGQWRSPPACSRRMRRGLCSWDRVGVRACSG